MWKGLRTRWWHDDPVDAARAALEDYTEETGRGPDVWTATELSCPVKGPMAGVWGSRTLVDDVYRVGMWQALEWRRACIGDDRLTGAIRAACGVTRWRRAGERRLERYGIDLGDPVTRRWALSWVDDWGVQRALGDGRALDGPPSSIE